MLKRRFGLAVLFMMLGANGVVSGQQSARKTDADAAATTARGHRSNSVLVVLRKHVDSVDFQDQTFEEILDWVREQGPPSINVVVQWRALGAEGVGPDALVSLRLENAIVADVLNEAMEQVSEVGSLRYHGTGNTLKISTESDFNRKLEVRVYDVADILVRVQNFRGAPRIEIQQQGGGGGGGAGQQQQLFGGGGGGGGRDDDEELGQQGFDVEDPGLVALRTLIEDTIAPETWEENGGQGIIRPFNKALVIRASIEVHEMIAGVFVQ